jgi:hypothetical protein
MVAAMKRLFLLPWGGGGWAAFLLLAPGTPTPLIAGSPERPVLVELFTSQGCSSCPPAEAYLGELATRDDLVVLSMHVNYWDYIGWADPFASDDTTNRQRAYGQRIGQGRVYTPQMVMNGVFDAVGSRRGMVNQAIAQARNSAAPHIAVGLALDSAGDLLVTLPTSYYAGDATVWLARYDGEHLTEVPSGENRGRTLRNVNVVRELRQIGIWSGQPLDIRLPAHVLTTSDGKGNDGCVIIVQEKEFGRVLGVARMPLVSGES